MNLYEKKYKEAQGWIEKIYPTLQHEQQMEAEAFFPELKEGEDEKIKKEITELVMQPTWKTEKEFHRRKELCDWLEKQGEQTSVDKIEPKFKVGDWIISNNKKSIYQVIEVKRGIYVIRDNADNYEYHIGIEECEKSGKLFTVQDAKDGDVLVSPPIKGQEGKEQIFIFKGINSRDYVDNCIEYYCRVYEGVFYENENGNGYMGTTSSPIYPATKEQRGLLFQKMKKAGYTWNADKKELKKIEQKPAEWSEEDGEMLNLIIARLHSHPNVDKTEYDKSYHWLKSLRPQSQWKPSDAQMEALLSKLPAIKGSGYEIQCVLETLYDDLKKLKGE